MKNTISRILLMLGILSHSQALQATEFASQTFMYPRPLSFNLPLQQAIWHSFVYHKDAHPRCTHIQMIGAYQTSIRTDKTAQYFLPPCRNELLIAGDESSDRCVRDVRSEWLGITNSAFRGRMSISPSQKQMGGIFEILQDIEAFTDLSFFEGSWIDVMLPIVCVQNSLHFKQYDILNSSLQKPGDIIQAFNQPNWNAAKLYKGKKSKFGLEQIIIRFGKAYLWHDNYEAVFFSGVTIPTGPRQNSEYTFDPFLGNNGHFGLVAGGIFQIALNENTECVDVCLFADLQATFLFRNNQRRTFDLFKKPWSRYLLFNHKDGPPNQNIPGVNVLTRCVHVKPYDVVDFATGLRVIGNWIEAEAGYGIWGHGKEKVRIRNCAHRGCDCFKDEYGIAGVGSRNPHAACPLAASASTSTIAQQSPNDEILGIPVFVPITIDDIDIDSARSRSALSHKIFASLGFTHSGCKLDSFIGMGGFYEMQQRNSALKNWGFWCKIGSSF